MSDVAESKGRVRTVVGGVLVLAAALGGAISFISDAITLCEKFPRTCEFFGSFTKPRETDTRTIPRGAPDVLPEPALTPHGNVPPGGDASPPASLPVLPLPAVPSRTPPAQPTMFTPFERGDILIKFGPYEAASPDGVEIEQVDRQSRLSGWLCPGDRLVSVDGQSLKGGTGAELRDDLVRRLIASSDFAIRFAPKRWTPGVEQDDTAGLALLRRRTVEEGVKRKRDC